MANALLFGIQTNGIKHTHDGPMPDIIDIRFRMVKEAGVFDYVDKTPAPEEVEQFLRARDKYDIPVQAGGWFYALDSVVTRRGSVSFLRKGQIKRGL